MTGNEPKKRTRANLAGSEDVEEEENVQLFSVPENIQRKIDKVRADQARSRFPRVRRRFLIKRDRNGRFYGRFRKWLAEVKRPKIILTSSTCRHGSSFTKPTKTVIVFGFETDVECTVASSVVSYVFNEEIRRLRTQSRYQSVKEAAAASASASATEQEDSEMEKAATMDTVLGAYLVERQLSLFKQQLPSAYINKELINLARACTSDFVSLARSMKAVGQAVAGTPPEVISAFHMYNNDAVCWNVPYACGHLPPTKLKDAGHHHTSKRMLLAEPCPGDSFFQLQSLCEHCQTLRIVNWCHSFRDMCLCNATDPVITFTFQQQQQQHKWPEPMPQPQPEGGSGSGSCFYYYPQSEQEPPQESLRQPQKVASPEVGNPFEQEHAAEEAFTSVSYLQEHAPEAVCDPSQSNKQDHAPEDPHFESYLQEILNPPQEPSVFEPPLQEHASEALQHQQEEDEEVSQPDIFESLNLEDLENMLPEIFLSPLQEDAAQTPLEPPEVSGFGSDFPSELQPDPQPQQQQELALDHLWSDVFPLNDVSLSPFNFSDLPEDEDLVPPELQEKQQEDLLSANVSATIPLPELEQQQQVPAPESLD